VAKKLLVFEAQHALDDRIRFDRNAFELKLKLPLIFAVYVKLYNSFCVTGLDHSVDISVGHDEVLKLGSVFDRVGLEAKLVV
jgi:hypothetical protein